MLYDFDKNIQTEIKKLENSQICKENQKLILKFHKWILAEGLSKARQYKYLINLRKISEWNNKPFTKWSEEDIIDILAFLENNGYKRETVNEYKKALKKFFKWLNGEDWKPLKLIKMRKDRNRKPEVLSEDKILRMIEVEKNLRNKAIISVGYEGGFRIGELAGIKIKDVEFDKREGELKARIRVKGKTGERIVPLRMSVPHLRVWIEIHPFSNDPNSFLFCSLSNRSLGEPMKYQSLAKVIKNAAVKAGIKKRVHPHILRHTRATVLAASSIGESIMSKYLGWVIGSDMPRVYIHLVNKDVEKAIDELYGIDGDKPKIAKPLKCPRCGKINEPNAKYCSQCALILDEGERIRVEMEEPLIAKELMNMIVQNPNMLDQLKEMLEFVKELREKPELMRMLMRLREES